MDKKKFGKILKQLRKDKKLSQNEFAYEMSVQYGRELEDGTISKWECGKSIPEIALIEDIADFYQITVDEIMNGQYKAEFNLKEKYFIYNDDWCSKYSPDDLYNIREEQELLIETRFKELLMKMVGIGLTVSEDKEFDFLVIHFYRIFFPAINCKSDEGYRESGLCECAWLEDIVNCGYGVLPLGGLSDIKLEIHRQSALMHKSSVEEKFWEANKKFVFSKHQNIWDDVSDVIVEAEDEVRRRISKLDDYEKDILLAVLQTINVTHRYGKLEVYEKQYQKKYDEEELTKRGIKLLIECGAKLNKVLLGYWKVVATEFKIIDILEEIYDKYKRPLLVPVCEQGKYRYFAVENIQNNRVKMGIAEDNILGGFGEKDFEHLEKRLYNGEKNVLKPFKYWICGENERGAYLHARREILGLSLKDYMNNRDFEQTEKLLKDLNNLPLEKLREIYFPSEYKGEYIDDSNRLSTEELKKKYYIEGVDNE
ncbi:MAG: hypothetical protein DBX59_10520 [Bacillota bacterium]|nr:MAG: hypothetical protein DBX59_10520 [Bacillota bacterium]